MKTIIFIMLVACAGLLLADYNFNEQYNLSLYFKELNQYKSTKYFNGNEFANSLYFKELALIGFTLTHLERDMYIMEFFYQLNNREERSPFYYAKDISMEPYRVLLNIQNIKPFAHKGFMMSDFTDLSALTANPLQMLSLFLLDEPMENPESEHIKDSWENVELLMLELNSINNPPLFNEDYIADFFVCVYHHYPEVKRERKIIIKNQELPSTHILQNFPLISQEELTKLKQNKAELLRKAEIEKQRQQEERLAKIQAELQEKDQLAKLEAERKEQERLAKLEAEQKEKEKLVQLENERKEKEKQAKIETEKKEQERLAKIKAERKEQERLTKLETEQKEKERLAQLENERKEKEKQTKIESEKHEHERLAKIEAERNEQERLTKLEAEQKEKDRLFQLENERKEKEKQAKMEAEKQEQERLAKIEAERKEQERLAKLEAEQKEKERLAQLENERKEKEKQAKMEAEKKEHERLAKIEAERKEQERLAKLDAEQKEKERLIQLENERKEKEKQAKMEAERIEKEKKDVEEAELAKLIINEEIEKKKHEYQITITPVKSNFQNIDVSATKFEYSIEGIDFLYRDYLDVISGNNQKNIELKEQTKNLQLRILVPRGYSIENTMPGYFHTSPISLQKKKINLPLTIQELPKTPIIFIDKSEILPVEWLGVEALINHLQKTIPTREDYAFYYINGEKIDGGFQNREQNEIEDLIWDYVYPLSTHSGIRYEHILPLGENWRKSGLNTTFYPEVHLFLSNATVRALITQPNSLEQSAGFVNQLVESMKEKTVNIIIHVKDSPDSPLDFSKISIPCQVIK
jgi:hypothetical protein